MSDKQSSQASQRKTNTSRNIKKLRTITMVCSLTSSWQQWVSDNQQKQANEPSGWAPVSLGGPTEELEKTWVTKKPPPTQVQPKAVAQTNVAASGETDKTSAHHKKIEEAVTSTEPPVASLIKTKQVVKTVTSGVKEKGMGVGLLTEKIKRDTLPSSEEIDRQLTKKCSPTRRRKCSNVVSSLTKSWKQVETEQMLGKEGIWPGKSLTGGLDKEDSGHPDTEKDRGHTVNTETHNDNILKETGQKDSEGDAESAVRIKRLPVPTYKKEAEDANKINALAKKYSPVGNLKSRWQNWASEHTVNQRLNPFSENFDYDYSMSLRLQRGQEGYGRPKEGTKTAERAKRAEKHIHREIADMCYVIRTMADADPDGKTRITFGELFERYVRISDKVVGILMRARKHGKVAFEGEMLWQGQDDGVIITLLG